MRSQPREQGARRPVPWSARSRGARMGLRVLVLAGAAGVAWLFGSSAAHADEGDLRSVAESSAAGPVLERAGATTAITLTGRVGESPDALSALLRSTSSRSAHVSPAHVGAVGSQETDVEPTITDQRDVDSPRTNLVGVLRSSTSPTNSQAAREAVPTQPDNRPSTEVPTTHPDRGGSSGPVATAVMGLLTSLGSSEATTTSALPGTITSSWTDVTRPVTGLLTSAVSPVSHTLDAVLTPAAPILDVVGPVTDTVATVTEPVTGVITDVGRAVITPLPVGVPGPVGDLLPPSATEGQSPAVRPDLTVVPAPFEADRGDVQFPRSDTARSVWEDPHAAGTDSIVIPVVPITPDPLPLQHHLPRSGTSSGTSWGSSHSTDSGASATAPTAISVSLLLICTLLTTVYFATRRELAGEPVFSPD